MGRGRAKAKQTKVARELKYRSVNTDFSMLERELRGDAVDYEDHGDEVADVPDQYADLAARYADADSGDDFEDLRKTS